MIPFNWQTRSKCDACQSDVFVQELLFVFDQMSAWVINFSYGVLWLIVQPMLAPIEVTRTLFQLPHPQFALRVKLSQDLSLDQCSKNYKR